MINRYKKGNNTKLSKHFTLNEFDCKCNNHKCKYTLVNEELIVKLEELRYLVGDSPLIINSAYRCKTHNKDVGGAKYSQHVIGNAVDIRTPSHLSDDEFADIAETIFSGVGRYKGRVHVDVRESGKARWDDRKKIIMEQMISPETQLKQ